MFAAIASQVAGSAAGSLVSGLFGSKKGGGADLGSLNESSESASLKSSLQGSTVPSNAPVEPTSISGSQAMSWAREQLLDKGKMLAEQVGSQAVSAGVDSLLGKKPKSASQLGADNRAYLDASFPELNPWEKAGAAATGMGTAQAEQSNQMKMLDKQLDNQKDIARMNNETQIKIAGIQSQTSRDNTADQVFAQNELVQIQKIKLDQEVQSIVAQRDLTYEQTRNAVQSLIESQARVRGIHATTEQTRALTDKVAHEIRNIDADTDKKKYGSGHIASEAFSVGNMISDGLSDIADSFSSKIGGIVSHVKP